MADCADLDLAEWMSRLPPGLHDTPLNELAIPGSHNSFSYGLDPGSELGPDIPPALRLLGAGVVKGLYYKWVVTQNQSFQEQLDSGIRYFDLRVAVRPSTGKLHFIHGFFGKSVECEMQVIKKFLDAHQKEVVILDFNHFYGMDEGRHKELVDIILKVFDQKLCMCVGMDSLTMSMLWENRFQVVVVYHHKVAEDTCEFWPGQQYIRAPWPNTPSVPRMLDCLSATYRPNRGEHFHVCQGVLTVDAGFVIGHPTGNLRNDIAKKAMPALLSWVKDKSRGRDGVNIVIADCTDLFDFANAIVLMNFKL